MVTPFHHQPEAQHPSYPQERRPITPSLGQKQTFKRLRLMSALPPKADITAAQTYVRFVPKADI